MSKILKKALPRKLYDFLAKVKGYLIYQKCNTIIRIKSIGKRKLNILEDSLAVKKIIEEKKSIARFGDGEFMWMLDIPQNSFQNSDEELAKRLLEVINSKDNNLLIGIPQAFNSIKEYRYDARLYWAIFIHKYFDVVSKYLNYKKEYINTNITRPYIDYKDKTNSETRFNNLKKIWQNRDIIIIEGEKSKLGVGNDLFDNARSLKRIICPSKNAFSKYNDILGYALSLPKDKLFLISLGPTATVLAYDLSKEGYQALDIGHIDIEYEWFRNKATDKIAIEGKYVNEAKNKSVSSKFDQDEIYNNSIIKKIL